MPKMKFGLFLPSDNLEEGVNTAKIAERQGYYSVSNNDHFYSPVTSPEGDQLECFTALTAIAASTEKIHIVPAVAAASFRNPALLTKIMCTLDIVSKGRFICGLGAGWQDKEYVNHGFAFPPLNERLEQLDETLQIIKAMCSEAEPSFSGKHFNIRKAYNNPRPIQERLPIMLGGSGTGLLRIAAREADIINIIPPTGNGRDFVNDKEATLRFTMARLENRIATLHRFMDEIGRPQDEIEIGGLCLAALSEDENDPVFEGLADQLGFSSVQEAKSSPVALMGTPEQVRAELEDRYNRTGMSYYILFMAGSETQAMWAEEISPAFST